MEAMLDQQILDIKKDLEFVETQIQYLDKYLNKIQNLMKSYKGGRRWWSGPAEQHELYSEMERWLRSYSKLEEHIKRKLIADEEIKAFISKIPDLHFVRPKSTKEENLSGMTSFLYYAVIPYRMVFNNKKTKVLLDQVEGYKTAFLQLKKAAFKIEAYYMDGV